MPNEIKVSAPPTKLKVGDLVMWKATLPELGHDEAGAPTVVLPNEDCIGIVAEIRQRGYGRKTVLVRWTTGKESVFHNEPGTLTVVSRIGTDVAGIKKHEK